MATTFQVSDILADIAVLTNSPPFGASTRVTSTQATYWLAQSVRALSALLRQNHADDREFLQTMSLSTVPGFNLVSLPVDCGELHAVLWARGVNDYVLVRSAQQDDLISRTDQGWDQRLPVYRLEGEMLAFYPAPNAVATLQVYYTVHVPTPLGTTVQARLDFDRWVTLDVAAKVQTAKSKDPSGFLRDKAMLEQDLLSRARAKDVARVNTIRDTRGERALADYRRRWH